MTGLNNNAYQIGRAKVRTAQEDLVGRVDFVKGNFMEIPFEGLFCILCLFYFVCVCIDF